MCAVEASVVGLVHDGARRCGSLADDPTGAFEDIALLPRHRAMLRRVGDFGIGVEQWRPNGRFIALIGEANRWIVPT
jgi:hypothetical protein